MFSHILQPRCSLMEVDIWHLLHLIQCFNHPKYSKALNNMYKKICIYNKLNKNNNSHNIKLQIKSFLKKMSIQLYFKRVNVPTISKARWQSIVNCWSSIGKGSTAKSLSCHFRDYKQCFIIRLQAVSSCRLYNK